MCLAQAPLCLMHQLQLSHCVVLRHHTSHLLQSWQCVLQADGTSMQQAGLTRRGLSGATCIMTCPSSPISSCTTPAGDCEVGWGSGLRSGCSTRALDPCTDMVSVASC